VKRRSHGCSLKRHEDAYISFNALQTVSPFTKKINVKRTKRFSSRLRKNKDCLE
jgi:hypothetical protein